MRELSLAEDALVPVTMPDMDARMAARHRSVQRARG